jgi:hypothetical protein
LWQPVERRLPNNRYNGINMEQQHNLQAIRSRPADFGALCRGRKAGPEIKTADTSYRYYASCKPYKESQLGKAVLDLDAPALMETGGNIGQVWTRVLHYHYNCCNDYQKCADEEQFFLANGYGEWQWKHYHNSVLAAQTLINNLESGTTEATLPCADSYEP